MTTTNTTPTTPSPQELEAIIRAFLSAPILPAPPEPFVHNARDREEADNMREAYEARGGEHAISGVTLWDGPVPPVGSYEHIDEFTRMSTAEFFFLRKANTLSTRDAVALGNELCGYYATRLSRPDIAPGIVLEVMRPRTTTARLREYLAQVADTPEGRRALCVLAHVEDNLTSRELFDDPYLL